MLKNNASDPKQAEQIDSAIAKHSEANLEDASIFDSTQGNKILGHIFGDKADSVTAEIAKKYNVDPTASKDVLAQMAPMIMGMLGKGKAGSSLDLKSLLSGAQSQLG